MARHLRGYAENVALGTRCGSKHKTDVPGSGCFRPASSRDKIKA